MTVAIILPTLGFTEDEQELVEEMLFRMDAYNVTNRLKEHYYEGRHRARHLGISIPPHMRQLNTVIGWPTILVDSMDERLDWQGWVTDDGDDFGLSDIYRSNDLDVEAGMIHLDAMIYGTSFITVGAGYDNEPNPLITVESARYMTGIRDPRTRRLSAALKVTAMDNGVAKAVCLYLPYATIDAEFNGGRWAVTNRDDHNVGRVMVAQMINRPRASRTNGQSEITRAVRSLTDQGVRTLLGMEINREFYSAPQRYIMGADGSAFQDENGDQVPGWETVMGRMLAIPNQPDNPDDPEGAHSTPTMGQFTAASPAPYLEQIKGLSQLFAAEAGLPAHYLGFISENPTSADAIRAGEARLVKKAEKHQTNFGKAWREVGLLALIVRDGQVPDNIGDLDVKWGNPATPTRAAAADETAKLIGSGVLKPNSGVTYDRLGFSPAEKRQLESESRAVSAGNNLQAIKDAVQQVQQPDTAPVPDLQTPNGVVTAIADTMGQ